MERRGRTELGAEVESNAGAVAEYNALSLTGSLWFDLREIRLVLGDKAGRLVEVGDCLPASQRRSVLVQSTNIELSD
jgi:hypothetical protein